MQLCLFSIRTSLYKSGQSPPPKNACMPPDPPTLSEMLHQGSLQQANSAFPPLHFFSFSHIFRVTKQATSRRQTSVDKSAVWAKTHVSRYSAACLSSVIYVTGEHVRLFKPTFPMFLWIQPLGRAAPRREVYRNGLLMSCGPVKYNIPSRCLVRLTIWLSASTWARGRSVRGAHCYRVKVLYMRCQRRRGTMERAASAKKAAFRWKFEE